MYRLHGSWPVNPATSTPTPSPRETAIQTGNIVVDEQQNGATTSLDLRQDDHAQVKRKPFGGIRMGPHRYSGAAGHQ